MSRRTKRIDKPLRKARQRYLTNPTPENRKLLDEEIARHNTAVTRLEPAAPKPEQRVTVVPPVLKEPGAPDPLAPSTSVWALRGGLPGLGRRR